MDAQRPGWWGRRGAKPLGSKTPDPSFSSFVDCPNQGTLSCPPSIPTGRLSSGETLWGNLQKLLFLPCTSVSPGGEANRLQQTLFNSSCSSQSLEEGREPPSPSSPATPPHCFFLNKPWSSQSGPRASGLPPPLVNFNLGLSRGAEGALGGVG